MRGENFNLALIKNCVVLFILCSSSAASTIPKPTLDSMWTFSLSRLKSSITAIGSSTQYPRGAPQTGGKWNLVGSGDWTSGFFPGCLWFAYEKSGDTVFRNAAQRWTASLESQKTNTSTHDVGFMMFCSYGNGYRLLKTSSYLPVLQTAAQSLSTRYKPLAGIIDSWDFAPYNTGWEEIIDNMMNLELLFWVSANGGSATYRTIAASHAEKAMTNHFRPDSSTYHVVRYSTTTGAMISQETRQGYSNSSCWARGQAWAVYGFTMAYRYTKDARFLATAEKAAGYYIKHLPADRIPFWDFNAPGIPTDTVPRDASSSAIVASGLLELASYVGAPDSSRYCDTAVSLIRGLWATKYRGLSTQASILNHSTGSRMEGHDVDMGIIYADYYFLEALLRYENMNDAVETARFSRIPQRVPVGSSAINTHSPCNLQGREVRTFSGQQSPGLIIGPGGNRAVLKTVRK
jgi:unsaturated chondroitin disaccharide hydrolase